MSSTVLQPIQMLAAPSSLQAAPTVVPASPLSDRLSFHLPPELEATEPPEARGLARDQVRLLVSYRSDDHLVHARFRDLPAFLQPGDLVVVNTSGTLPAALPVTRQDGAELVLHLSTHLPADLWVVELRSPGSNGATGPFLAGQAGEWLDLPAGARAEILAPYSLDRSLVEPGRPTRLWLAALQLPLPLGTYLEQHGRPIRYSYVQRPWPLSAYQTVYATEPGSAEMPSAGRASTPELITALVSHGVGFAPLLLHTGVSSPEAHEAPYEEYYRLPAETARAINAAHASGERVIAVGTTVVRAIESAVDHNSQVHPAEGWTRLVITPQRGVRAIDGILTGWHELEASHLLMLEAIAGRHHLEIAYAAALASNYLWHKFGDLHLILP